VFDAERFEDWFFAYLGDEWESTDCRLESLQRFQLAMLDEFVDYWFGVTHAEQNFKGN
jgi:hypothetical protein